MRRRHVLALALLVVACGQRSPGNSAPPLASGAATSGVRPPDAAVASSDAPAALARLPSTGSLAWGWEQPQHPVALADVWGSGDDVFVVGDRGTILRSRDGGTSWAATPSGVTSNLHGVWGTNANDVYAVGYEGTIVHSTDGGATWARTPAKGLQNLHDVWGTDQALFVIDSTGTLHASSDGGATWTASKPAGKRPVELSKIWSDGATLVITGGEHHSDTPTAPGFKTRGMVLVSTDAGKSWRSESLPARVRGGWSSGPVRFYATDAGTRIVDGAVAPIEVASQQPIAAMWGASADRVIAVGHGGTVLESRDRKTWTARGGSTTANLTAVWGTGASLVAVGEHGVILHSGDGGANWTARSSATAATVRALFAVDGIVLAADVNNTILRRVNGTWTSEASGSTESLVGIWGRSKMQLWLAGAHGSVLRRGASGWAPAKTGLRRLTAIGGNARVIVVGGTRGEAARSVDHGATWTPITTGAGQDDVTAIAAVGDELWLATFRGALFASTDDGATWTRKPDAFKDRAMGGATIAAIWADSTQQLLAGYSGIATSADRGGTWRFEKLDDDIVGLARTGAQFFAVGHGNQQGRVYTSLDGRAWKRVNAPGEPHHRWPVPWHAIATTGDEVIVVGAHGAIARYGR